MKQFKPYLIVTLAALFYTYEYLLRIEPSVMVAYLENVLGTHKMGLALLFAMYYYAYTPLQLGVGILTDRYGPRRMLIMALISCLVGVLLFQWHIYLVACIARLLIGAGSAFAFVGAIKLAAMWLPDNRFALFAGLCTSLGMIGAMLGDVVLSWGVNHSGVKAVLNQSFWAGFLLLVLFVFFLQNKGSYSAKTNKTNLTLVFTSLQRIIKHMDFWFVGLMGSVLFLSLSGIAEAWGIDYFQERYQLTTTAAAHINSMIFFGWLAGSPFMGWLSDYFRMRVRILILGCFISAIIGFSILWLPLNNMLLIKALVFLFGIACSSEVLVFAYARDKVGSHLMATAASFMNLLVMCSGLLAPIIIPALSGIMHSQVKFGQVISIQGYQIGLSFVPMMMLIGGCLGLLWHRTRG